MDTRFRVYYLVTFNDQWWVKRKDGETFKRKDGETLYNENHKALCDMVPDLKMTNPNWQVAIAGRYYNRKVSCLKEDEDMLVNALKTLEPNGVKWVKIDQEKYSALHAERNRRMYKRKNEWGKVMGRKLGETNTVTLHLDDEAWNMLKKYADYYCESIERIAKNMFYIGLHKCNWEIKE